MNRKQLLAGVGLCIVILLALLVAGGVRLSSDAAPAPGATSQTAGNALADQPSAPNRPAADTVSVQSNAGSGQAQLQLEAAQPNLVAQPTAVPPTAVPAAPAATATPGSREADEAAEAAETPEAAEAAETPEASEAAETPEAGEAAETPEPAAVAGTPVAGEDSDHDGDKAEQGETSGQDSDNATEQGDHEAAGTPAPAAQARITQQQAEQTALAANRGTTVVKTELDDEDGAPVYKVKLSNGAKVKVNAVTGAILSTDAPENDGSDH